MSFEHMHEIDPKLALQVLQFLYTIYQSRWGKKPSEKETRESGAAESKGPDPERMGELIKEVESHPKQTQDNLAAQIDKKFPPEQAIQVKSDLRTLATLVSPTDLREYDYFGIIENYAKGLQNIAMKTELFRLRGEKIEDNVRVLEMPTTGDSLLPPHVRNNAIYPPYRSTTDIRVRGIHAFLGNGGETAPLTVIVEAAFTQDSYGTTTNVHTMVYKIASGQERNWLQFDPLKSISGFRGFEWRLNAADVRQILNAMKADITGYLAEIESERPIVAEVLEELEALRAVRVVDPNDEAP